MYEETDSRGMKVWSYSTIGKTLGLSETTVFRIINGRGAYQAADRFKTTKQLDEDTAASLQKLLAMRAKEEETANVVTEPEAPKPATGVRPEGCPRDLQPNERWNPYGRVIFTVPDVKPKTG